MFKEGDRVRYVGNMSSYLQGKVGTVTAESTPNNIEVDFDDGSPCPGLLPANLELVTGEPAAPEPVAKREMIVKITPAEACRIIREAIKAPADAEVGIWSDVEVSWKEY